MLAVEVHGDATAGDAEDRVLLVGLGVAHPGVDALHVVGQRLGVEARRHLGAVGALGEVGLDGGGPQLVLHGRRGEAGDVDVQLRRLLIRRLAVGLADLVAAVGAPVVREHFLHVPGAVLLVGGHEVVPGVIGSAAAAVLSVEALVLQGEHGPDRLAGLGRLLLPVGIVRVGGEGHAEVGAELQEVQRIALALSREGRRRARTG